MRDREFQPSGPPLRVPATRSDHSAVVLHLRGDVVGTEAPYLWALLKRRLQSCAETVVVDLRAVSFLALAGVQLLATAEKYALLNGKRLLLIADGNAAVRRAVRAACLASGAPPPLEPADGRTPHLAGIPRL